MSGDFYLSPDHHAFGVVPFSHLNMNEKSEGGAAFSISIGLAFIGGYADASSYLLARTFTGHLTGNCVLAAVSAASGES
jgi:hypothetical protein